MWFHGDTFNVVQHGYPRVLPHTLQDISKRGGVRSSSAAAGMPHSSEEPLKLVCIQFAVGPYAGTQIEAERPHFIDCLAYVLRREAARQEEWSVDAFPDRTAETPIVSSARAAQLLDRKLLVAGIEQDGIHMRRHPGGLLDRLRPGHMDNLHDRNSGQSLSKVAMRAMGEMVADLDRIRLAETLLLDYLGNSLPRSQQECSDSGWDGRGNLCDPLIADDTRPARHA